MSVYWDTSKKRWRFSFNRKVRRGAERRRIRATKLLPKAWSQRQAEKYGRDESARLYAEATGIEQPRLKLLPAVKLYIDHRCPNLRNGKKAAQELLNLVLDMDLATRYLDEVGDIATEYEKKHGARLAPATRRNRLSYLKAAVNYARKKHKYGKGLPNFTEEMDLPVPHNERQVYAKLPELRLLWKRTPEMDARAVFTLTFYLGLRWRAELLTRLPEHIVRNGRDVWLEIGRTKNGDRIMKYVHPEARWALDCIPFERGDGYYYRRWHRGAAAIQRPEMKPHDLRHSLASEIISRKGGTLQDVMAALHQRSTQAAKRYSHLYPERLKAILRATGGRRKIAHRKRGPGAVKVRRAA